MQQERETSLCKDHLQALGILLRIGLVATGKPHLVIVIPEVQPDLTHRHTSLTEVRGQRLEGSGAGRTEQFGIVAAIAVPEA